MDERGKEGEMGQEARGGGFRFEKKKLGQHGLAGGFEIRFRRRIKMEGFALGAGVLRASRTGRKAARSKKGR